MLKLVLLAYADHANTDTGVCWPTKLTIALKTGLSERAVQRAVKDLIDMGFLRVKAYPRGGRGRATEYVVVIEGADPTPPPSTNGHNAT